METKQKRERQRMQCECGIDIMKFDIERHRKTKRHKMLVELSTIKDNESIEKVKKILIDKKK